MVVRIANPAAALCAADMHLDDTDPALAACFFAALEAGLAQADNASGGAECAPQLDEGAEADRADGADHAPTLFLLGDLFEYWIGDDYLSEAAQ